MTTFASVFRSVGDMWSHRVGSTPDSEAWWTRENDAWTRITWRQADRRVREIAHGLLAQGIRPGDRVAILSATRFEWLLADLAIGAVGAATTAVFPTTGPDELAFVLEDAAVAAVFCDTAERLAALRAIRDRIPTVRNVFTFDGGVPADGWSSGIAVLQAAGREAEYRAPTAIDEAIAAITPDALASLIYTSGTTGRPKGVMHDHDAWIYEAEAIESLGLVTPADRHYLFLPLAHVFARVLAITSIRLGIPTAIDTDPARFATAMQEVRPTFFAGVPRVFEKIADRVRERSTAARWAVDQPLRKGVRGQLQRWAIERAVGRPLREALGGRLRFAISGAAPLSPAVGGVLAAAGIPILEGYGLTESGAASCVNRLDDWRIGSVGPPLPGCDLRLAEDGEIELKSRGVMRGYWGRPADTATVLGMDGWLRTGDLGELDRGHLRITGRKKDILVTSGGKKVAPRVVEAEVERHPLIHTAILLGEGRPYCVALLGLDPSVLGDREPTETSVSAELAAAVREANKTLAPWETVKRFAILPELPSESAGTLTPSGKLRRHVVAEKYAALIDELYRPIS
jgi:long-chain acyl-CoA synthetase